MGERSVGKMPTTTGGKMPTTTMITDGVAEKDVARFWSKVDKRGPDVLRLPSTGSGCKAQDDRCWLWTAPVHGSTPTLSWNGRTASALRVVCELERGVTIPFNVHVRRTCGNELCVNPAHLSWDGSVGTDVCVVAGMTGEVLADFWSRVEKHGPDECWLWTGVTSECGTPVFYWKGRSRTVPRIMWELERGEPIPEGVRLRRTCGNKLCVNPAHLVTCDGSVLAGSLVEGSDLARPSEGLLALFWAKVDKRGSNECWPWTGACTPSPCMKWGDKNASALRIMWELERGTAVPKGGQLRRTCGNLACINPRHLKLHGGDRRQDADGTGQDATGRPSIFLLADMAGCGLVPLGQGRYRVLRSPDWDHEGLGARRTRKVTAKGAKGRESVREGV